MPGVARDASWFGDGDARRLAFVLSGAALGLIMVLMVGVASTVVDPLLQLAAVAVVVLLALAVRWPRAVVLATLLFLPFVGVLRRASGSYGARIDPLTLIGPVVAATCLFVLIHARGWRRSPLSIAVTAMVGFGLLQILNPAQGSPVVGLVGAGLFVGPLVWFYVGQSVGDAATLARVLRVLRLVALVTAAYGVKQLVIGFTGFENEWIAAKEGTYVSLNISGSIRPFSTFASSAEYSWFLALGAVLFSAWPGSARRVLRMGIVFALLLACFYAGSRTIFVIGTLATVTVVLAHRINSLARAGAVCIAVGIAGLLVLSLVPLGSADSTAGKIRNRTLAGLTKPFDRDSSTLGLHVDSVGRGIATGLRNPLGRGAAYVNLAGAKLSGNAVSAEHDVPNVLVAYGWVGGGILVVLVVRVYRLVESVVRRRRRDLLAPAVFALALFGSWFTGELYAVSSVVWFFLGSVDRLNHEAAIAEGPSSVDRVPEPIGK